MKYVLRIVVVAVLCLGIFFGITAIVNNKKPYSISDDYASVYSSFKELDNNISRLNGMTEGNMNKLFEYNSIYSFEKTRIKDFADNIEVLSLNKNESGQFKTLKNKIKSGCLELNSKVNKIYEYNFEEANPNAEYLNGLIDNANETFKTYIETLNNACFNFNKYIDNKIYSNKNYNFKDVISSNLFNMIKSYLEVNNGYTYISTAITNYNEFILSEKSSSFDASSFVQNYYTFEDNDLVLNYKNYFEQGSSSNANFSVLINFVLGGDYYEKD